MVYRDMTNGDDPTEVIVRTKAARAAKHTWTDRIYMFLCNYFNTSNKYASDIADHFSIQCIDPNDRFKEDLGGDSLDMVEIAIMLEDEYDVTISDKAMNMFYYQVKDLFYYLTRKVI